VSDASLELINPEELGAPSGYAHGVLAPASGRLLFVAGQIGWEVSRRLASGFVGQFEQALRNVVAVVRAGGGEPAHVAQLTVYVTDRGEYLAERKALGGTYRRVMGRHYPAMALVEVSGLVETDAKVEIAAVAVVPERARGR
jgi:enamine deaminase RidA (YjgF/YER057c/UK114 family)